MDGRRNFSPDPDAEPRWYPDDRGYDERGRDDRRDDRADERRDDRRDDRPRDDRPRDERGYGDDRGYTPTRYAADDREYDDGYRVPEPRGAGRPYGGDPAAYGDSPSGQFSAPVPGGPGAGPGAEVVDLSAESVSRSRRSEAIERSALQRPVSGGAPGVPLPPPVTVPSPPPQASFGPQNAFAAPTTLTAAVPAPQPAGVEPGGAVYRSKRPGLAVALVVLTVVFEVPVLRLFLTAMTADTIQPAGTLASIFMILGLPMFALGLYGLIGGAAASAPGVRAWSRTPLAYLPIAVLLFIAAALST